MSGDANNWPYPAPGRAGSNAVGVGAIGEAPLGTVPAFDWRQTILSQYANSDRITGLVETFFSAVDQTANFDAFYDKIWNLQTAEGFGLDVWGRIVGVNRILQVVSVGFFGFSEAAPTSLTFGDARFTGLSSTFGFAEAGDKQTFGEGSFATASLFQGVDPNAGAGAFYAGGQLTSNYELSEEQYLRLIYAKAAANISNGSIPSINAILLNVLFPGRGNCYVRERRPETYFGFAETGDAAAFGQESFYAGEELPSMEYEIVFRFTLTPVDLAIIQNSGVLPKTTGVRSVVSILP